MRMRRAQLRAKLVATYKDNERQLMLSGEVTFLTEVTLSRVFAK